MVEIPLQPVGDKSSQKAVIKTPIERGEADRSQSDMAVLDKVFRAPIVDNKGSTARDYCAMERTYLSHVRFGLVLSLLSASLLLKARLPHPRSSSTDGKGISDAISLPLGSVYSVASLLVIIMGWVWYEHGLKALRRDLGFVEGVKVHEFTLGAVAVLIFGTCVLLLVDNSFIR